MKRDYQSPQVEVVEIEIEDAILALSANSVEDMTYGKDFGDKF